MTTTADVKREMITLAEWTKKHSDFKDGDPGYGTASMLTYDPKAGTCLDYVAVEGVPNLAEGMRPMDDDGFRTLLRQIGKANWMAISGLRVEFRETGVTLPVGKGWAVAIDLAPGDTYTVRRVYKRGVTRAKGERTGVYAEQVSDVAYKASCFENVEF